MAPPHPPPLYLIGTGPGSVFDQISEPVLTFDHAGRLTGANAVAGHLLAVYTPDGSLTQDIGGYPTAVWQTWQATPPRPTAVPWTWTGRGVDGTIRAVAGVCSPLYDRDETLTGLIWIGQRLGEPCDVTPPVTQHAGIARQDHAGRQIYVSPTLTSSSGLPPAAFLGRTPAELGLPADRVAHWAAQFAAVFAASPASTAVPSSAPLSGYPVKYRRGAELRLDGTPAAVLNIARELTDQARLTAALTTRIQQQAATNDLGRLALSGLPLDALFQHATTLLAALLAVPYTSIMESHMARQELQLRAGVGWSPAEQEPAPVAVDWESPVGTTLRRDTTLYFADLAHAPSFTDPAYLGAHGVVSGLITLIRTPAHVFGMLAAFTTESRIFSAEEVGVVELIAQLLAAAIARSAAEERFTKAFHTNPEPMSLIRLADGLLIDVNERWLACFGGTRATVIGRPESMAVSWLDPTAWPTLQARIGAEGTVTEVESAYRLPAGGVGYRRLSAQRLDLADEPHALLMSRDVTAYKQATAALRASEARFATAFHASPDGYAITRQADDTFVDVNTAWCRMLGYRRAEVLDHTSGELAIWPDPAKPARQWAQLLDATAKFAGDVQLRRKDGTLRFYQVTAAVLDMAETACVLTILRDVTEARAAEAALRASEERFAKAFHGSPYGVCILQLPERRLVDVNTAWTRINGYTRDEAVGHTLTDLDLELDAATNARLRTILQTAGRVENLEVAYHHRDGTLRQYRISAEGIELADARCVLITTQDVTAERAATTQLQQQYDFLAALTGNLAEGVYALDRSGRISFVNSATEALLGWSTADLLGQPLHTRIRSRRPDGTPLAADDCAVLAILHTGQPVYIDDDVFVRQDGQLLPVAYAAAPIVSAGTLVGVVVAFRDTTVQKHALVTRRLLSARLNTLLSISRAILAAQTPAAIVEATFARLPEILSYHGARVSLLQAAGYAPQVLLATGTAATWPPPTNSSDPDAPWRADEGELRLPLLVEGRPVGLLELATATPPGFRPSQVTMAQEVADQLAVALHHAQLFDQVTTTRRQMQELAGRLVETQEAERRHLARELHDDLGQALTALKLGYQATRHRTDPATWAAGVAENVALIDEVIAGVRRLAQDLRPPLLDELGLGAALESYLTRHAERAGLRSHFDSSLDAAHLTPGVATTCFRVAQEALTNVLRHAQATQVGITLSGSAEAVELTVWDDGRGFDVATACGHALQGHSLGLVSMQERVVLVGGTLQIESVGGAGTTVRARMPRPATLPPEVAG